ncbi:restriction endonuclease [Acinetobacter johnsonii]|uniref:restriction endonuclease n=1 Tax=Acinetobacter johnsonii TaxID=40214 RepID=UPI003D6CE500
MIECKNWKTNIPKEKVLALRSIVEDIGAHRGFIVSNKGFQSGAALLHKHSKAKLLPSYLNLSGNLGVRSA